MRANTDLLTVVRRFGVLAVLSVTILPAALSAQIGTQGTFTGTVKDSSGAVVSGATITATNIATGESQTAPSNQDGLYRLPQLPPGHYRMQASQTGFRAEVHTDIELTVGQTQEADFTLQVGANTETVTVTGEAPLVDTSTSTVSSLVNQDQVQNLPLNGRDYSQLLYLTPGVSNGWGGVNQGRGNPQFEIAGARSTSTRYMMDGSELSGAGITTNSLPNTASSKLLGVEALAEFAVISNDGDASLGKEQGGVINMVTRSGTNNIHGSAYEFFRSKAFDAANYFNPTVLPLTRNNYGAAVGGPIRKNKTFFFANLEQYRDREDFAFAPTIPTPSVLGVGFNGIEQIPGSTTTNGVTTCNVTKINPVTGFQTNPSGTTVQQNAAATAASFSIMNFFSVNIDPKALAAATPSTQTTNGVTCPTGIEQVSVHSPQHIDDNFVLGRIDHQISDKQSLFGRYMIQTGARIISDNDPFNQLPQKWNHRTQLFTLGDRYAFASGLLNQFTLAFNRGYYDILDQLDPGLSQSSIPSAMAMIPGATTGPTLIGTLIVGSIASQNASSSVYNAVNDNTGGQYHSIGRAVYEADDQLSKNVGQHFLQGGVQFQRFFINDFSGSNPTGLLTFPNLLQFAQGVPSQFQGVLPCCSNAFDSARQFYIGTYVQDSYKVTSHLTLNFGLRWEFISSEVERHNRFLNWYPVLGGDGACAATISCYPNFPAFANGAFPASFSEPGLVYPAENLFPGNNSGNWAPRLGFAWNVFGSGKTSVRGGFGLFYNQIQLNPTATTPFFAGVTLTAGSGGITSIPWPNPGTLLQTAVASTQQPAGNAPSPRVPAMSQYNLTIQQEVAPQTTLSLSYVGNEGYHEGRTGAANLPAPIPNAAGRLAFPSMTNLTKGTTGAGNLALYDATSNYNSFQATLEKRVSHGLQVKAVFAWSKALDEAPDPAAGSPIGIVASNIFTDPSYDKGPPPYNVSKNFTFNWIYDLPLGKHERVAGLALNGWQFGGIYHQQSGLPFSLVDGVSQLFSTGNATTTNARPDYNSAFAGSLINSGATERPSTGVVQYLNPAAFTPAPYGVLGNSSSGAVNGPGLANVDISLVKFFNFTERYKLQFRVDAFNVLNHPNFSNPANQLYTAIENSSATSAAGATSGNSCFIGAAIGAATAACSQNQYALGEINPVAVNTSATAGRINITATDNRELQFALKLVF